MSRKLSCEKEAKMSSRERVKRALTFDSPDRVPRDLWTLPIALDKYKRETEVILKKFPLDIEGPKYNSPLKNYTEGNPYEIGAYVDEWGCTFKNVQKGVCGQVKEPLVKNLSDIE